MFGKSYHAQDKNARQGDRALWPDSARKNDAAITHGSMRGDSMRGDLEEAASRSCKKQGREQLLNWIALLGVDLARVPPVPDVMDSHGFALNTIASLYHSPGDNKNASNITLC